jgi:ribosomal protein S18 acetylase RimI-like enzyme
MFYHPSDNAWLCDDTRTRKLHVGFSCTVAYKLCMDDIVIRRAIEPDLPTLGRLGALLMQTHYSFDKQRFMAPGTNPAEGYRWFLSSQLNEEDVIVLVAERAGFVVGYVYAGLEPRSWKELREPAGFIHDVAVDESSRRTGVATALVEAAIEWLRARGAPRVLLWTAEQNGAALSLFSRLRFRRPMIEMTRELQRED